ncbi:MAG: histone deacetylase [Alphaproteobacteria bacterium]
MAVPPLVFHPDYTYPLPPGHRFPMGKFGRIRDVLVEDGVVAADAFMTPEPASRERLEAAHRPAYVEAILALSLPRAAERRLGLPLSEALVRRARAAVGGTMLCAQLALERGLACNIAGGSHHAHPDHGAGFCVFNDVAVAIRALQDEGAVGRVLVFDCDVHQGDGTAAFFADDPSVFTCSIHCEANYPHTKGLSDLDIGLKPGTGDNAYLAVVRDNFETLLSRVKPGLVFYNAGVDPHGDDLLGQLTLSDDGLMARDRHVIETCLKRRMPLACVVGGGYGHDLDTLARRHSTVHRAAVALAATHGLGRRTIAA